MQFSRIFISLFLLLIYSLSYAHNVIPHTGFGNSEQHDMVVHQHHQTYSENSHASHKHISHNDHYDEGLYDLIVCFLNEIKHPSEDCLQHYYLPGELDITSNNKSLSFKSINLPALPISQFKQNTITHRINYHSYSYYYISSLPLASITLRGPPAIHR